MKPLMYIGAIIACSTVQAQQINLSGSLPPAKDGKLVLSNVSDQKYTIEQNETGAFKQSLDAITKGHYNLPGAGNIFLKPGYSLHIAKKEEKLLFSGKGSAENNLMIQLNENARKISNRMEEGEMNFIDPADLLKELEAFRKSQYQLLNKKKLDADFVRLRKTEADYVIRNLYREYVYNYGVDIKKRDNYYKLMDQMAGKFDMKRMDSARKEMQVKQLTPAEKKMFDSLTLAGASFNDEDMYKASPVYRGWMDRQMQTLVYTKYREDFSKGVGSDVIKSKIIRNEISNPFIKGLLTFKQSSVSLKMSNSLQQADSIYQDFKSVSSNAKQLSAMEDIYSMIKKFSKGAPAPDFSYKDVNGETVSLSSLKGNLVYIDVWATWCGPCKAEIPHLKKVEEAYHGKPVKFVSISVDEPKDAGKWKSYVIDNNLKGIQLMTENAFDSEFIKNFNIAAIPRFILIDKEGKIISANALRPSNKALQQELDKQLAL